MKFKQGTRRKPIDYEKDLINYWRERKIFEKSVSNRPAADSYVFYDGPPFITGVPHHGTLLSSIVKDAVPRYFTMKGKRVERVWGWDCHGLPAEVYTERKLGIKDRQEIGTKISLEDYIKACRDNMTATGSEWENTIARIGRWVDFKGAYKTMDKPYMESIWWAFKKLYEAGKIYEGEKVLLYCTRDATPIAKAEVAMDNSYQDVNDPSVYVKFKLSNEDTYLLAWTTTPWTLPANTAVAVNKDIDYVEANVDGQHLILAKELLEKVLTDEKHQVLDYKIIRTMSGADLVGRDYEPLFDLPAGGDGDNTHKVWSAPYVTVDDGTGIVHLAPAYGEEDYELAKANNFPIISMIDDNGLYTSGEWKGQLVWDVNKVIAKELYNQGKIWKVDYIKHSYPHCHRCGTRLMYRAHPSWFMDIETQREDMLRESGGIYWFPEHFKEGRWPKNIAQAPDWNLSRDRFWATAMPVWKAIDQEGNEKIKVVGSYQELKDLSGVELDDYHRPWIDEVTFEVDGLTYKRIDKVLDSWFEAGSMPFAQFHYPFENQQKFELNFPGDFIAEYVGQIRAWFYYLHAVSVGIFGQKAFKNAIVTGTIAGDDGRKMSKSYGNYTDPNELMDLYSADSLRFLLLSSPLLNGEDYALHNKDVSDVARKLNMIWNMYDFFTLYASVDGWEWDGNKEDPYQDLIHPLDQWIVSRMHQLSTNIDRSMQRYDIPGALSDVLPFIDDASNWYIRRSRKRFWKTDNDQDKDMAYRTLHYLLCRLSIILAPFTPFLSEELYRNLTGEESVHLCDWPASGHTNDLLMEEMAVLRKLITGGLDIRARKGIKVRQPLSKATLEWSGQIRPELLSIAQDELNVKSIQHNSVSGNSPSIKLDTNITPDLKLEGHSRELVRLVQNMRKKAGFSVDDRIKLSINTTDEALNEAYHRHKDTIFAETLAIGEVAGDGDYKEELKLDQIDIQITIEKVN